MSIASVVKSKHTTLTSPIIIISVIVLVLIIVGIILSYNYDPRFHNVSQDSILSEVTERRTQALKQRYEFKNYALLNKLPLFQRVKDIEKNFLLAKNKTEQGNLLESLNIYNDIIVSYQDFLASIQVVVNKRSKATTAADDWYAYRDLNGISSTPTEAHFEHLLQESNNQFKSGMIERAGSSYESIATLFIDYRNKMAPVVKNRKVAEIFQRDWYKLREKHQLSGTGIDQIDLYFKMAKQSEADGKLNKAAGQYHSAELAYKEALKRAPEFISINKKTVEIRKRLAEIEAENTNKTQDVNLQGLADNSL